MHIHWPLVLFTLLNGLGIGAFCYVAVSEWFGMTEFLRLPGAVTALAAMWVGGFISVFHLSHPFRAYNIIKRLNTGIGKELVFSSITGAVIFLYIILLVLVRVGVPVPASLVKAVTVIGFISGVILAFELGATYVLPARPAWNTLLWPFVYAASSAVTGLFAIYVLAAVINNDGNPSIAMSLNRTVIVAIFIQAATVLAYLIFLKNASYKDEMRSPARLLKGNLSPVFWTCVVAAGMLVPLVLTIWARVAQVENFYTVVSIVGFLGVFVSGCTLRALMYMLGSEIDPVL